MKKHGNVLAVVLGTAMLACGIALLVWVGEPAGIRALPYILVGVGCGVLGQGASDLVTRRNKQAARQSEIAEKDERNEAIRNKAGAKAYGLMLPVLGALLILFALMGVDVAVVLALVAAYVFVVGCNIYFIGKYNREM